MLFKLIMSQKSPNSTSGWGVQSNKPSNNFSPGTSKVFSKSSVRGRKEKKSHTWRTKEKKTSVWGTKEKKSSTWGSKEKKSPVWGTKEKLSSTYETKEQKSDVLGWKEKKSLTWEAKEKKSAVSLVKRHEEGQLSISNSGRRIKDRNNNGCD